MDDLYCPDCEITWNEDEEGLHCPECDVPGEALEEEDALAA